MQVSLGRRVAIKEQPSVKRDRPQTLEIRYIHWILLTVYLLKNNGDYVWDDGKK
jgi:hypothetical protein